MGGATECRVYTPNKRCRPEAPLTSLPKLTPVKNVEEDRRDGGGRTTTEDKNHKRQQQGEDGQSRVAANRCVLKQSHCCAKALSEVDNYKRKC